MATIGTFLIYTLAMKETITPAVGFTMLELLGDLSNSFISLPAALDGLTRASTALAKINRFLDEDEVERVPRSPAETRGSGNDDAEWTCLPRGAVALRNASFAWKTCDENKYAYHYKENKGACCGCCPKKKTKQIDAEPSDPEPPTLATLTDVSLSVAPGDLVVVYGATGAGKSSLLAALFGDIARCEPCCRSPLSPQPKASPGTLFCFR